MHANAQAKKNERKREKEKEKEKSMYLVSNIKENNSESCIKKKKKEFGAIYLFLFIRNKYEYVKNENIHVFFFKIYEIYTQRSMILK